MDLAIHIVYNINPYCTIKDSVEWFKQNNDFSNSYCSNSTMTFVLKKTSEEFKCGTFLSTKDCGSNGILIISIMIDNSEFE